MDTDIVNVIADILTQLPVLAIIWWMFIKPMMDSHRESLEYYRQRREDGQVIDWPWETWNSFVDSAEPGMLAFLAAAEGTGKTVYAEQVAEHWAKKGAHVGFFHLELNKRIMRMRRYARHSGVSIGAMRSRDLTPDERHAIRQADERLARWPGSVTYIHSPGWTMDRIIRACDIYQFDAVVIDYMQKIAPTPLQLKASRGDIVRWGPMAIEDWKNYCEDKSVYSLVLSQLTAEGKQAEPNMNQLRWLKELSEKANVGLLAWREISELGERDAKGNTLVMPGAKSMTVNVKADKNTMGRTGVLPQQVIDGPRFRILDKPEGL